MADYYSLKEILGKPVKGVIVKQNEPGQHPRMSLFLVFSDDTEFEIYADCLARLRLRRTRKGPDCGNKEEAV
jgi:hypothetical protein